MKRLLFVGPYPPPYGGIASHLYDLLPGLEREGYEVISLTEANYQAIHSAGGMKNIFFKPKLSLVENLGSVILMFFQSYSLMKELGFFKYLKYVSLAAKTYQVIMQESINMVFIYQLESSRMIPILRKKVGNSLPITLTIYGSLYTNPEEFIKQAPYIEKALGLCDVILSSSKYCADSIKQILGISVPVEVIYVGVDTDSYRPEKEGDMLREELGIPLSAIVFLFFGRMLRDMGLDHILNSADRLLSINPDVYLVIAGASGELSEEVKELSLREPRIKYCPDVPSLKKPLFYSACDILLALTRERRACMGVSIKEAMASGKPVIASTSGGIPEAIEEGINGFLVNIDHQGIDRERFIEKAILLANDPSLRKRMGVVGRNKAVSKFSIEETVEKYQGIIKQFLRD